MSIKVIWQSTEAMNYPTWRQDETNHGDYGQLRELHYLLSAQMLVGVFEVHTDDFEVGAGPPRVTQGIGLFKIWRDGHRLELDDEGEGVPIISQGVNHGPLVQQVDDGTLAWAPDPDYLGALALMANQITVSAPTVNGAFYYMVNENWPMDVHTGVVVASYGLMSATDVGFIAAASNVGYVLDGIISGGNTTVTVTETPSNIRRFESVAMSAGSRHLGHPRSLVYINTSTAALICAQVNSAFAVDNGKPARIIILDTSTSTWTTTFDDVLPGSANVAAYDPRNRILYAVGRYASNSIMYSCKLKRAPVTVASPTTNSGTLVLGALTATVVKTTVTDSLGSAISNYPVQWLLSSTMFSGGSIVSAYSYTNDSGVATVVYVGPREPPAGLQEIITARVDDTWESRNVILR